MSDDSATAPGRRWIVTQIGSRQHYAVPRALAAAGALDHLYTDIWLRHGRSIVRKLPSPARALAGRYHAAIAPDQVTAFNAGAIRRIVSFRQTRTIETAYDSFTRTGEWFCRQVNRRLARQPLSGDRHAAFLFNTGALETLHLLRERGVFCVVDQIDPARVEEQVTLAECEKWPGWQKSPGNIPTSYYDRLAAEWAAADGVVVNSLWTKQALIEQGVAANKIHVVPQAYENDLPTASIAVNDKTRSPLKVLWLGQVILRKGIQYLFEAARALKDEPIEFTVAGWIGITDVGVKAVPPNVKLLGTVDRSAAAQLYRTHDLFVLPTMSDGFAITQLEAMSFGLPVIATPRCGNVVTDGIDGLVVPAGDAKALSSAIYSLHRDRHRLLSFSTAAMEKSARFTLERFAAGVQRLLPV